MPAFNLNSGWGAIEAQIAAATKNTTGKIFVAAATTVAGYDKLQQLFGFRPDAEGTIRFYNTIDAAVSACTANRGDVVLVAPGHAETITTAGAIAIDVAGVSVIGLGNGDNRPVITFGSTDNAASITISADDCALKNVVLLCNDDGLTNALNVTGNDADIDVHSQDTSAAIEFATVIRLDTADNANVKLRHNGFIAGNAMVSCIRLDNSANVRIDIDGYGILTTAWVEMVDVASANVQVKGRMYTSGITGGTRNVVDTITGSTWDAILWDATAAAVQRGGSGEALAFDDVGDIASALTLATADAVANADIGDQVGNKTDTAIADTIEGNVATTQSLNRLSKSILQRIGADSANNTAATTLVAANRDGSILERLEDLRQNESATGGLVYQGSTDAGMGASTVTVVSADLAGQTDDFFNTKYYMMVVKNTSTPGGAPENEVRQITDYVSATGTFTVTAFSVNVEASDEILVMHESLVLFGRDDANNTFASTNVAANADGSVLERLEYVQTAGGAVADAALADTIEGAAATTQSIVTDLKGVLQRIGADNANNTAATTLVGINADGSVLERLEYVQDAELVGGVDAVTNVQMSDVVGNKTDAAIADTIEGAAATTQSLVADMKAVLQRVGADSANNTAATTLVAANEDGSVLERLERIQQNTSRGTGTALAANESLADVLYAANGIAAFPTAAAPANGISIAEVLREVYDQSEKTFTNAAATLVDATTIFTIAGGPIEIISLVARCVTGNDATASTLQWRADPTDGASATFSAASASLANALAGAIVVLQGNTLATAPIVNATGVGLGQTVTNGIVVGAGVIQTVIGAGSTTGTWMHHLRYKPLSRGVVIT